MVEFEEPTFEATKNLSNEFREKHPGIEWRKIAGLRDKLIHHYILRYPPAGAPLPKPNSRRAELFALLLLVEPHSRRSARWTFLMHRTIACCIRAQMAARQPARPA